MKVRYLLALAALTAAVPAVAQRPDSMPKRPMAGAPGWGGGMMMSRDHQAAMMAMMAPVMKYAPERLLARNGQLKLTAQQMTALTALRDAAAASAKSAMDEAKGHQDEMTKAMDAAAPDTAAVLAHFRGAHDAMGRAMAAHLVAAAQAKALLTDAQRKMVDAWQMRRPMGGHPRDGMGMGAPPPKR
jgi:hypothetical protein